MSPFNPGPFVCEWRACPFCASNEVIKDCCYYRCKNCHAHGPFIVKERGECAEEHEKKLKDAWNTRT